MKVSKIMKFITKRPSGGQETDVISHGIRKLWLLSKLVRDFYFNIKVILSLIWKLIRIVISDLRFVNSENVMKKLSFKRKNWYLYVNLKENANSK